MITAIYLPITEMIKPNNYHRNHFSYRRNHYYERRLI